MPDSIVLVDHEKKKMFLVLFRGSISLIEHWFLCKVDPHCLIWVMKEYGAAESWSKLFMVDLSTGRMTRLKKPLDLRSNSEVILASIKGDLVSYDTEGR